jgi:hypothetical protein
MQTPIADRDLFDMIDFLVFDDTGFFSLSPPQGVSRAFLARACRACRTQGAVADDAALWHRYAVASAFTGE